VSPLDAIAQLNSALAGRYAVEREIGQGGMATVYLARDLRHDRRVALKVLLPELGAVLGVERFQAEIRVTANLQHPNLLPLFDSGEANGLLFYVMPYVEGESLRTRLERERQLPIDEAIRIATAIAGALDYAHRHDVIHRDLKPENILLHEGQPLLADFGIALAVTRAGGNRITQTGLSLGTPQYMSPEQATGERTIDGRTDIYSLGAVTYEMLTGEPPHAGNSSQAIIARVLTEKPRSVRASRPNVPPHVDDAVACALEKLPADRFASAAEFAAALADESRPLTRRTRDAREAPAAGRVRRAVPWAIAVLAAGVATAFAWRLAHTPAPPAMRFTVASQTTDVGGEGIFNGAGTVAVSPDGRVIVYVGTSGGIARLYRRALDDPVPQPLAGTEGALEATFSPDGRWIAYAASDNHVKKIPAEGGPGVSLVQTQMPAGLSWSARTGPVLGMPAASPTISGLSSVSEHGDSAPHVITRPESGMDHFPFVLDDGVTVLFTHLGGSHGPHLAIASLASGSAQPVDLLLERVVGVADGVLLYMDPAGTLMAVSFDARRQISGSPVRVADIPGTLQAAALARNGTLVMRVEPAAWQAVLVDEHGMGEPILPDTVSALIPRFSPDGRRAVFNANFRRTQDTWMYDFGTRTLTKLGLGGGASSWLDWAPDGRRVLAGIFAGYAGRTLVNRFKLLSQPADASASPDTLAGIDGVWIESAAFAPDQRAVAIGTGYGAGGFNVMVRRLSDDTSLVPFAATAANEVAPRFSPDGHWIAYASDETGRYEVYAKPYPGPGARVQLSDGGGGQPVWAKDGKRLFYRLGRSMMAADLARGARDGALAVVRREQLFAGEFFGGSEVGRSTAAYDVAPDGRHFLMGRAVGGGNAELLAWTGWLPALKKRLAEGR
jgi:serine/threonine-protein kinase